MLKDRCPNQKVPNTDTCKQISDVFFKLAEAHKAYGEAAQGLAELALNVTPEQYTLLLAASAMPTIQVVVPGQLIKPLSPPQVHQTETSTAIGRAELIKNIQSTKSYQILIHQSCLKKTRTQQPEYWLQQCF